MHYLSTRNANEQKSFEEAIFQGLAPDGGLYVPSEIPQFTEKEIFNMREMSFSEISTEIAYKYLKNEIPKEDLKNIIVKQIDFDAPTYQLDKNTYILELFHGPTFSFKDFGARFLAGIMSYYTQKNKKKRTILTATSGDTGSAVAQGFYNIPEIEVIILYPKDKVSNLQRKQMTTLGNNIKCIEILGNFDDCQKIVKDTFANKITCQKMALTSANSINIGRLIPQMFYYFYCFSKLKQSDNKRVTFSVPSGNFGNLTAGLIAKKMGLKNINFIAATNVNDTIPQYLTTGIYQAKPSIETISSAMDIGNPSNFERIQHLYDKNLEFIKKEITGISNNDQETKKIIRKIFEKFNYLPDPHCAVALLGLEKTRDLRPSNTIEVALATAHPAKFNEQIEKIINEKILLPKILFQLQNIEEQKTTMTPEKCSTFLAKTD